MTIRDLSKRKTLKRNEDIMNMLLKHSVKQVAVHFNLSPHAIYKIAMRFKKKLGYRN